MNPSMFLHKVHRVYLNETRKYHDKDGHTYHCRDIVIHDAAGETFTVGLMADAPDNTADCLTPRPIERVEAGLAEMDNDTLDALANAIRAERQSRDRQGVEVEARLTGGCLNLHPRDCPGVTVTDDDGVPF